MGWTSPRTFVAGELETATIFNTHLRDNLLYLHGDAGTIAFVNAATFTATSGTILSAIASGGSATIQVTSSNSAGNNAQLSLTNTGQRNALIYMDRANDKLRISQNGTSNPAISIDASGNVGLSATTTPKGILHGYDTIAGFLKYEFDGLDGTARTLIPDGAGDVLYGLCFFGSVRSSGGTISMTNNLGGTALAPSGSTNIYSAGSDTVALAVAANGSVTVQRTGGSLTYKVNLFLMWL
jgi:hypothetical protein